MNLTVISVSSSQTGEAQKAILRRTELKKNPTATQTLPFLIWSSIHFFLFPLPVTGMVNLAGKRKRATALPSAENVWSPTWEVQGFGLPWLNGDRSTTACAKGTTAMDTTGNEANPLGWALGLNRATWNEVEGAGSITLSHICLLWGLLLAHGQDNWNGGLIQQRIIRDQEARKYHKRLCSRLRIVKLMYCIMIKINSNKKNTSLINEMFSQRLPEANLQAVTQEHFIGQHITTPKSPTLIHAMQEGNEQLKKGIRMHFPPALIPSCGSDTGYVP